MITTRIIEITTMTQCSATTKDGYQCRNNAQNGEYECAVHAQHGEHNQHGHVDQRSRQVPQQGNQSGQMTQRARQVSQQGNQFGAGCRVGASGRCNKYDGEDDGICTTGPSGRCRTTKGLKSAYNVKKEATPAQLAALAKARAARKAKTAVVSQSGAGCRVGASGRCNKYDGEDDGICTTGPSGRCRTTKGLKSAYNVKKPATQKQLDALAKARAARKAKAPAKPKTQAPASYFY
jgi:hypothetical protein